MTTTPTDAPPSPSAPHVCGLFDGASGKLVVLTLTGGAFLAYVLIFRYRRRRGTDSRTYLVFWLDLAKMGFGQGMAYVINVLNAHRNSAGGAFDATSWYFPTFLNDELIAVPLGVLLWHIFIRLVRRVTSSEPACAESTFAVALKDSGKYHPDGAAFGDDSEIRYSWWAIQLVCWASAVVVSRLLGGLVVPTVAMLLGDHSPYYLMASWIYALPMSCAAKRWTFAGVFRILIDILQLAIVDFFNKFHAGRAAGLVQPIRGPMWSDSSHPSHVTSETSAEHEGTGIALSRAGL